MSKRLPQINSLLETELSQLLSRELELPSDCLITLTNVETSADLRHAKVWLSILPEAETRRVFKILNKKKKEIEKLLHKKLYMKPLPNLEFIIDKTEANASRMDKLIDNLKT